MECLFCHENDFTLSPFPSRCRLRVFAILRMAQVCGGTTFDFVARRKHDAAQRVLSRAADIWSKGGRDALSLDSVVAVLLHIFLSKWSEYGGLRDEARTLEMWLPLVAGAQEEADALTSLVAH